MISMNHWINLQGKLIPCIFIVVFTEICTEHILLNFIQLMLLIKHTFDWSNLCMFVFVKFEAWCIRIVTVIWQFILAIIIFFFLNLLSYHIQYNIFCKALHYRSVIIIFYYHSSISIWSSWAIFVTLTLSRFLFFAKKTTIIWILFILLSSIVIVRYFSLIQFPKLIILWNNLNLVSLRWNRPGCGQKKRSITVGSIWVNCTVLWCKYLVLCRSSQMICILKIHIPTPMVNWWRQLAGLIKGLFRVHIGGRQRRVIGPIDGRIQRRSCLRQVLLFLILK